jgi:hypothetical protein
MALRVDFGQSDVRFELGCSLGEGRGHLAARPAPGRPKIHQQGQVMARQVSLEAARIELDRLARQQGAVALPAVGAARQIFGSDPVGGVAVRADEMQG